MTKVRSISSSPRLSIVEDKNIAILLSIIICLFVWITNAAFDVIIFQKESLWDSIIFTTNSFNNIYRLTTLAFFLLYGIIVSRIITKRRLWGENLLKCKTKIKALIEVVPDTLFRMRSDGTILESVAERETGTNPTIKQFLGQKIDALFPSEIGEEFIGFAKKALETGEIQTFDFQLKSKEIAYYSEARLIATGKEEVLAIIRDITDRKKLEEELRALSLSDDLTGLCNRRGFFVLSRHQLKLADRTKKDLLLLFADVDHMKEINDTYGHREGDQVLYEVGKVFKQVFRKTDIVARFGGDEFAVLMIDTTEPNIETIISSRLEDAMQSLNAILKKRYTVSLSIGMERYNHQNPCTIDELLDRADREMYRSKKIKKKPSISHI